MLSIAKNLVLQSIEANNWKPIVDAVKKWEAGNFKEQTAFVTRIENNRVEAGLV
jgi:hypothetical protein